MTLLIFAATMLMLAALLVALWLPCSIKRLWHVFLLLSVAALAGTVAVALAAAIGLDFLALRGWVGINTLGIGLAVLVQLLGTVIAAFSVRYLDGEPGQRRYVAALSGVLAAVHLLLLADHWLVLIVAWALVGVALQHLLCFYPDRPFALLAAHKKRIADWVADSFLIAAAALAWVAVGSGSLPDLWLYLAREGMSMSMELSAACLVLAVILRTALLPFHGWLIQVMEAPTPVSALLHAGVVNLGGYVLIHFSPLLGEATLARLLLVVFGLGTAVLAGLVMLTRISIKVRLAWSTVAQMGFMLVECGLGLYAIAALHLIGHSLYKAHVFLSASSVVRQTWLKTMRGKLAPAPISLALAPIVSVALALQIQSLLAIHSWPWWWSVILGFAWAPLLWLPGWQSGIRTIFLQALSGLVMIAVLMAAALLMHSLPLGIKEVPHDALGIVTLVNMAMLYLFLALLQLRPQALEVWHRWSYAGFYVDEIYTRIALQIWPARWAPRSTSTARQRATALSTPDVLK